MVDLCMNSSSSLLIYIRSVDGFGYDEKYWRKTFMPMDVDVNTPRASQ